MNLVQAQKNYLLGAIAILIFFAYTSIKYWQSGGNIFYTIGWFVLIVISVAVATVKAKKYPERFGKTWDVVFGMGLLLFWNIFLLIQNIIHKRVEDTGLLLGLVIATAVYLIFAIRVFRQKSPNTPSK